MTRIPADLRNRLLSRKEVDTRPDGLGDWHINRCDPAQTANAQRAASTTSAI